MALLSLSDSKRARMGQRLLPPPTAPGYHEDGPGRALATRSIRRRGLRDTNARKANEVERNVGLGLGNRARQRFYIMAVVKLRSGGSMIEVSANYLLFPMTSVLLGN